MGCPASSSSPPSGMSGPLAMRAKVVLPEPLAPTRPQTSPSRSSKFASLRARTPTKDFRMCLASRTVMLWLSKGSGGPRRRFPMCASLGLLEQRVDLLFGIPLVHVEGIGHVLVLVVDRV